MLGLWDHGLGYTVKGSEGYTYLNMPEAVYKFFEKYPGDFRLINGQFLGDLTSQSQPIILQTSFSDLALKYPKSSAYWEVQQLIEKYDYILQSGSGPEGYDLLIPPAK